MPNIFTLRRRNSRNAVNPSRDEEFIIRADARTRPQTPPVNGNSWFTRRRRRRVVPIEDDIFSAVSEPVGIATIRRQESGDSVKSVSEYPSIRELNLGEIPLTDLATPMHLPVAEVVGNNGTDCCLPGRLAQNCRICPEIMQPGRERAIRVTEKELGGKRRKTVRKRKRVQLKKRHYKKTRKIKSK
jgi:hypothetical protein